MKYFPFTGEPYRPQIGLKPLDLQDWIERDEHFHAQIRLKKQLLSENSAEVLQTTAEAEDGALELSRLLAKHLNFEPTAQTADEAFRLLARHTQEDWVLIRAGAPAVVIAGCVCFPSRWSLREKIGQDPFAVHAAVPDFAAIAKPANSFLERVAVDKPMWRLNWTIHDSDRLFCPEPHPAARDLTDENIVSRCFLRVERQTLRRLPQSKVVAFSIRTHLYPLALVLNSRERVDLLARSLENLPRETAVYKGMGSFQNILISGLRRHEVFAPVPHRRQPMGETPHEI